MNIIEVRNSLLFCQELPEHLFLLVGIILSWTSIWVFITSYRGTLGKVVKITCSQDDLRNSDSACVLQVSNAPPLAFHSPKCLLNDDSSPADVGVATKVCISKSPIVTPGGDDEGKILTYPQADGTPPSSPAILGKTRRTAAAGHHALCQAFQ